MPRAGFYAIHTARLTFRADGRWYADGEPVVHERLARLFSRYLRRTPAGGYEIWIDERYHADVDVEDTPYVVVTVNLDGPDAVSVELSDGTVEVLDPTTLEVGADSVLYCAVKGGTERARFLRTAYYQLADRIDETAPGVYQFRYGNSAYPVRQR